MTLEEVIRTAIIACGAAREVDIADPIANAVRTFLGSEEVVQLAARAYLPQFDRCDGFVKECAVERTRAALSSIMEVKDARKAL